MRARSRLSPIEIRKLWAALAPIERRQAERRMLAGKTLGKLPGGRGEGPDRVRDKIGQLAGLSGRTIEKCLAVYLAAEDEPGLFGPVVDYLESTENVHDAYNRMRRLRDIARVEALAPVEGRFATLVFDPPWEDDSVSENQRPPYATMTAAQIRALPVPDWQLESGHVYVHAPGPWLSVAIPLVAFWGYDFKQVLTYRKHNQSQGRYFRTADEYVVFGTRGGLMLKRADLQNWFTGPAGEHSAKPDGFYDLVRRASPGPYGEGFQRVARPGFANLYVPAAPIAALPEPVLEAAE